jgi:transposase
MTLSEDLKERVISLYSPGGMSMREVARLLNVSLGLVHGVVSCYQRFGQVNHPRPRFNGRPHTLGNDDLSFIREAISARPTIYLDELQYKLATVRGVQASLATISRTLSRMGLTRKALSREASERNEEVRLLWELDMAQYTDPEMFVFLDESAVDRNTVRRANGWSTAGTPAVERSTFLRGVRHSILPALTSQGMIALEIFEGSVNKERFIRFLRDNIVCSFFTCTRYDTNRPRLLNSILSQVNTVLL